LEINVSRGKANFSQRNNELKPLESCNVTAMVMALSYMDSVFPPGRFEQPEDNLRDFIVNAGGNPENHYQLSAYTNRWMGKQVTHFSTERSIAGIFGELSANRPVVLSGTFPGHPALNVSRKTGKPEPLGHIVCLAGFGGNDNNPDYVIWDDPYGDTLNNWRGSGNDIKIPYPLFIEWIKPCGNTRYKWGHFFAKEGI
jgi:hypothetical protein